MKLLDVVTWQGAEHVITAIDGDQAELWSIIGLHVRTAPLAELEPTERCYSVARHGLVAKS